MTHRLQLNPILCDAHGMCVELLPERIRTDDWGYPIVDGKPIGPGLLGHARRAVAACPKGALCLVTEEETAP